MKSCFVAAVVAASVVCGPLVARAEKADAVKVEQPSESREKMAQAHEKMASCLRSTKTTDECHEQMHTVCAEQSSGCASGPMHGKRKHRQ